MKIRYTLTAIIVFCSCVVVAQTVQEVYINTYKRIAVEEMKRSGVPASITLAQGILESGSGTSTLAVKANNHFGIKCHSSWTGGKIYQDDDAKHECFRVYSNAEQSFRDHSDFLKNNKRYASLFDLKTTDYKGWAHGLKSAGYATNPVYATRLITIIEDYNLHQYDSGKIDVADTNVVAAVLTTDDRESVRTSETNNSVRYFSSNGFELSMAEFEVGETNKTPYVILKYSTDIKSLTHKLGMATWELAKYNDLPKDAKLAVGTKLYLKPKRNKAEKKYREHLVVEGETMRDLSQRYAVKIKSLYKLNGWEKGVEPVNGSKVKLR